MPKSKRHTAKQSISQSRAERECLLLLKVSMTSMVSMGILIGAYFVPQSSYLIAFPWIVFALTAMYVLREFFLSASLKKRTLKHCLNDRKESSIDPFEKGTEIVSVNV